MNENFELENMRQQMALLKQKLEQQMGVQKSKNHDAFKAEVKKEDKKEEKKNEIKRNNSMDLGAK